MNARALMITLLACAALPACVHRHEYADVQLGDPAPTTARPAKPPKIDLSALKIFRNAYAVTKVGPYEHHFTVWYENIEPAYEELRVHRDPKTGKLHIAVDNGMFGGIGAPPRTPKHATGDLASLQSDLEDELKARAPQARDWVVEYEGLYRTVTLEEMMPATLEGKETRTGWNGTVVLSADASLTHLISQSGEYESGYGLIELTEPMRWVDFTPPANEDGQKLLIDQFMLGKTDLPEKRSLAEAALLAARRLDTNAPGPTIAEVAEKQGDSLLPPGIEQDLHLELSFYARPGKGIPFDRQQHIVVPIAMRTSRLVHETTEGSREGIIGGVRFKATATLTPRAPLPRDLPVGPHDFAGTLHLVVTDDHGHMFDRTYPTSGHLLVDGETILAPEGLGCPGSSAPSPDREGFHTTFPGQGDFAGIDLYVATGLTWDPRDAL